MLLKGNEMNKDAERSYIAFISYRHKPLDKQAAEMIQRRIENYKVPKEFREKVGGEKLGMVFRDEDELPASSSLSDSITYALDHSKYLIVICTPDLPQSKWCEQEIRYFLKTHDRDHILAVLADGSPEVSFSPYLLHTFDEAGNITGDTEPLAANIAGPDHKIDKKAFGKEVVRIFAALIGCPFDALWQRERRARTNRLLTLSGIVMTAMAIFIGVVLSKNAQIAEQNASLQRQMSVIKVDTGLTQLENFDIKGALGSGVDALLEDSDGDLYDHRVEKLLNDALYSYQDKDLRSSLLYSQATAIETLVITPDGSIAVFSDETMTVRAIDTDSGSLLWEYAPEAARDSLDYSPVEVFAFQDLIICKYADRIIARSPDAGKEIWRYSYQCEYGTHFRAFNGDGSKMLLLDQADPEEPDAWLLILDTRTGNEAGRVSLSSKTDTVELNAMNPWYQYAGAFSEDGRYFASAVYVTHQRDDGTVGEEQGTLKLSLFDMESFEEVYSMYSDESSPSGTDIIYGISILKDGSLFCARHLTSYGGIVTSLLHRITKTGAQEITNQTISSYSGATMDLFMEYFQVVPLAVNGNMAVIASENDVFFFNIGYKPVLQKELAFEGDVLAFEWADKASYDIDIWSAGVASALYNMNSDGTIEDYSACTYDQSDARLLFPVYGDDQSLKYVISVPDNHPGNILIMRNSSDESGQTFADLPSVGDMTQWAVNASPSGNIVYIQYRNSLSDPLTVAAYDAVSHEKVGSADFDIDYSNSKIVPLDNNAFLYGSRIYSLDGTKNEYLEGINSSNMDSNYQHLILPDKRVMSFYNTCSENGGTGYVSVWLDGKLLAASREPATGISFQTGKMMKAGSSGLVVGYGLYKYVTEDGSRVYADKDGFMAFDALSGSRCTFEELHPEAKVRMLAVGNTEPVFACADELGNISLYNTKTGNCEDLDTNYAISEIKAISFSSDDRYLLIITRGGKLECYDLQAKTYVYSEMPEIFKGFQYAYMDELSCTASSDGRYIYLKTNRKDSPYGYWLSLDQTSWTLAAAAENVYAALPADGGLYAYRNYSLYRYPIHTMEDLTSQAKQIINR